MSDAIDSPSVSEPQEDAKRMAAAMFLAEVLDIDDSRSLAGDLSTIKRDVNASIYTIQLDSSVGPAAFLVYAYLLEERGGDGHTGQELFESGLGTLQRAAERSTPGPRAVAHAEDGHYGFILATTPGTYRALTGDTPSTTEIEATPADLLPLEEAGRIRSDLAQELLASLKQANQQATSWLQAIQRASSTPNEEQPDDMLVFTPEEIELALYLLDDESIGNLLHALNLLVASAQNMAAETMQE